MNTLERLFLLSKDYNTREQARFNLFCNHLRKDVFPRNTYEISLESLCSGVHPKYQEDLYWLLGKIYLSRYRFNFVVQLPDQDNGCTETPLRQFFTQNALSNDDPELFRCMCVYFIDGSAGEEFEQIQAYFKETSILIKDQWGFDARKEYLDNALESLRLALSDLNYVDICNLDQKNHILKIEHAMDEIDAHYQAVENLDHLPSWNAGKIRELRIFLRGLCKTWKNCNENSWNISDNKFFSGFRLKGAKSQLLQITTPDEYQEYFSIQFKIITSELYKIIYGKHSIQKRELHGEVVDWLLEHRPELFDEPKQGWQYFEFKYQSQYEQESSYQRILAKLIELEHSHMQIENFISFYDKTLSYITKRQFCSQCGYTKEDISIIRDLCKQVGRYMRTSNIAVEKDMLTISPQRILKASALKRLCQDMGILHLYQEHVKFRRKIMVQESQGYRFSKQEECNLNLHLSNCYYPIPESGCNLSEEYNYLPGINISIAFEESIDIILAIYKEVQSVYSAYNN